MNILEKIIEYKLAEIEKCAKITPLERIQDSQRLYSVRDFCGALINKDVPAYALMVGVPARQIGWMSEYGEKLDLPLSGNANVTCERTGQKYQLKDGQVSVIGY